MNKAMTLIMSAALAATGCGYVDPTRTDHHDCYTQVIPPNCSNSQGSGPQAPRITLNTNINVRANPKNVCAQENAELVFKILPQNVEEGSVRIEPKDGSPAWLSGTNSPDARQIIIPIPDDALGEHEYKVTLDDGRCLDPRVHVQ